MFGTVNIGGSANDGTGDDLRTAFGKVNDNFSNIGLVGMQAANISATNIEVANAVTASYFIGDGSQITGLSVSYSNVEILQRGTSNVTILSPGGNILANVNSTIVANIGNNGIWFRGNINTTGIFINPRMHNYTESYYAANSGASITINLSNGTLQKITLNSNTTITMPAAQAGKSFLLLINSGLGSFTVSWSGVSWPSATPPTVTTTASRVDVLSFVSDGTSWFGAIGGQNYAA